MDSRIEKMAYTMVHYSTAVQAGETVLIRASSPVAEPIVRAFYQEILRVGATPVPYIHLRDEQALALEATDDLALLGAQNPMLEFMYQTCDVVIYLYADENPLAMADYPVEKQSTVSQGGAVMRNIQMARVGKGELRRCSAFFPTQGLAQRARMSLLQYEDFFYRGCKLHLDDPVAAWQVLATRQQHWVDYLNGKEYLHVRGPNVDLEMSVAGRFFINSAGRANFPCGEIFIGPVENSVNGRIKFTYPAYYGGNEVEGVELTFKDGLVIEARAEKNEAYLLSILDTDPGARRLGEFAIGTNYDIKRFTGSIVFDEKIGGTIHTAVGQAYPQTGGVNQSAVHWDMICDMKEDGEIYADGDLFYQNGQFLGEPL